MKKINFYKNNNFIDYGVINLTPIRKHLTLNFKKKSNFDSTNSEQVFNDKCQLVLPVDVVNKQKSSFKVSKWIVGTIIICGVSYFIMSSAFVESIIFSIPWLYDLFTTSFELNIPTLHGNVNYMFIDSYYWDVLTDILFLIL